jgi:predicted nuclease of predicted toxin-antitoxin system
MINLYNAHIETLSIHRVGNKVVTNLFISEQPFSLQDEIVPLIKEFFLKPFREKKKTIFSLPMKLIWITTTCINSSAILKIRIVYMKIQRISQDIYLSNQSPILKREVYVTYLTNVNINNRWCHRCFKSELQADFLQFEERNSFRNDPLTRNKPE